MHPRNRPLRVAPRLRAGSRRACTTTAARHSTAADAVAALRLGACGRHSGMSALAAASAPVDIGATARPSQLGFGSRPTPAGATISIIATANAMARPCWPEVSSTSRPSSRGPSTTRRTASTPASATPPKTGRHASATPDRSTRPARRHCAGRTPTCRPTPGADQGQLRAGARQRFHQLALSGQYRWSPTTRSSGSVAAGRMTQDEEAAPLTLNPRPCSDAAPHARRCRGGHAARRPACNVPAGAGAAPQRHLGL